MSQEALDQTEATEYLRRERALEWSTNSRDDVRWYRLSDAEGQVKDAPLRMTRSQSELQNTLREDELRRAEATVASAGKRLAARQQAANAKRERENARRALLGLPPEPEQLIAATLSGIEEAAIDYLQQQKGYVWKLCLDRKML